ncbi:hypothetical protein [Pseudomonas danubii]|uniref:hypothetical protein n=1 Tax=Pseudomonas danubii TaxID=2497146 RepID=UPI0038576DB2
MSRYKQLSDAYALNTRALIAYRVDARDTLRGVRDALRKHLGLIVVETDIVRITSDDGESVFPQLSKLDHGGSVNFNVAVNVGGDGGLPKTDVFVPGVLSGKAGEIVLDIPSLNLVHTLKSEEDYQEVAGLLFDAMLERLETF